MSTVNERMAEAVGKHIARMNAAGRLDFVRVFPNAPDRDGFTEWLLVYEFNDGGRLTVGAILRNPDQEVVEFHS